MLQSSIGYNVMSFALSSRQRAAGAEAAGLRRLLSLSTSLRNVYKQQYWAALGLPFWGVRRTLGAHTREQTDLISRISGQARCLDAPSAGAALLGELEHSCSTSEDASYTLVELVEAQRCVAAQAEALEAYLAGVGDEGSRRVAREVAVVNQRQAATLALQLQTAGGGPALPPGPEALQLLHAVHLHVLGIRLCADTAGRGPTFQKALAAIAAELFETMTPLAHLLSSLPLIEEPQSGGASSCVVVPLRGAPVAVRGAADQPLLDSLDQLVERAAALAWDLSWLCPLVECLRCASDDLWNALATGANRTVDGLRLRL